MPNPAQSDLHVNAPLTSVSVAYIQDSKRFLATRVFPKVKVEKQSDLYWKYSKSDWRRTDVQRRAPSTESPGVGWNVTTDSYFAHVYAVHKDIDDQLRANADSNFNLDSDATKFLTNQMLLKRDIDWASKYFTNGVWATEYTGVASGPTTGQFVQWNSATSDPLANTTDWGLAFDELNGFEFNKMVVGTDVWKALKNHPAILDRIKYTQKGVITEDLVASFFGVDELIIAKATKASGPQIPDAAAQDAAASYSRIVNKKSVLFCYAPPSPSLLTPSAGYTFVWNGYLGSGGGEGVRIKNFRMEPIASDRIEAEMTYDQKIVSPDMGVYLINAVA